MSFEPATAEPATATLSSLALFIVPLINEGAIGMAVKQVRDQQRYTLLAHRLSKGLGDERGGRSQLLM
jgi:hypothetical protein